jgi:hypothetical protein
MGIAQPMPTQVFFMQMPMTEDGQNGTMPVTSFPHFRSMHKLFNRLFSQMKTLQERQDRLDPRAYENSYGSLQLAVHHLSMCRNLLKTHLKNPPSQGKRVQARKSKKASINRM